MNSLCKGLLVSFLILSATSLHAQTTVITGEMVDSTSRQGEPNATLRIYKGTNMDKPVAMGVTDVNGKFSQSITGTGSFTILFTSEGRKKITREVNLTKDGGSINLGTLLVQDDSHQLNGVEVVANKPLVKMETGKMAYDVQSDADVKSNSVLDMLRKVPMVVVDGQDNITVNGSGSFKVYVDGKPNAMFSSNASQIFKSMPASAVQKIEVITNPGAKYDAEGTVGILNLVMTGSDGKKMSMNGYNGSIGLRISNREFNQSGFVSGQQGKLTYSANVMNNQMFTQNADITTDRTSLTDGSLMHMFQPSRQHMNFRYANISLGYELDSMSTINATLGLSRFHRKTDDDMQTTFSGATTPSVSFGYHDANSSLDNSLNVSADYQRFFNKAKTKNLIFSYLFDTSLNKGNSTVIYAPMAGGAPAMGADHSTYNRPKSANHTFQLDYSTPLSGDVKLNVGTKFITRSNKADSKYYNIVSGTETYSAANSSNYKNSQSILAFYAETENSFGKFGTKAGLRYEQTWEDVKFILGAGSNFKRHYGNLVPSLSFTYKMKESMNLGLSYTMRISRPGIWELNPFVTETATTKSYGNPDLAVAKSHKVSLEFNSFTPKFMINATLYGYLVNGDYSGYSFLVGNVLHSTYGNIIREKEVGLNLFANYSPTSKTRISLNGSTSFSHYKSNQLGITNNGWNYNAFLNLQQTLPWNIKWSAFIGCQGPDYQLQSNSKAIGFAGTSLNKDFFKDRLNISINYFNVLRGKLKFQQHSYGSTYDQRMTLATDIERVGISFTWKFGNTKKQFQTKQSNINNDFGTSKGGNNQGSNLPTGGM